MCGIVGMVSLTPHPLRWADRLPDLSALVRRRGPDASGHWTDTHAALGVERLRIMDTSSRADQPMVRGNTVLAFNGEVYNTTDLAHQFPVGPYPSGSDAERLLGLLSDPVRKLGEVDGMFGLAAWNRAERCLTLARDVNGEKPLYYAQFKDELWFASEIAPLLLHPAATRTLDQEAMRDFLVLGFIPEPASPFQGIRKLQAGHVLRAGPQQPLTIERFRAGHQPVLPLERALVRATLSTCQADVPLGVFLSGGLDSGILASIVTSARQAVQTFSVRFEDARYDEGPYAARVAHHLGTDHHEVMVGAEQLIEAFDEVMSGLSEPLADPALLPTWLLAREASRRVGVVLSGEGADEWLGGYPSYLGHALAAQPHLRDPVCLASAILGRFAGSDTRVSLAWMLDRFARYAAEPGPSRHLAWTAWGLAGHLTPQQRLNAAGRLIGPAQAWGLEQAQAADIELSLRDSLLVKLDRATMWFGLEARAPYLTRPVRAAAAALPARERIRGLETKVALRRMARGRLPGSILRRPKQGLSVPIAGLLNGDLKDRADSALLGRGADLVRDLLPGVRIDELLADHRAGRANHARPLWTVFTLVNWIDRWEQPHP